MRFYKGEMAPERGEGLLEESTGVAPSQESTRSPQVILHIKEGDGAIEASAVERSEDDDLTSLTWLQDKNLLKGINLRTSANGGAGAGGGSGANIAIADSGGGATIAVGSNAAGANLSSPVNGGMMMPVKQESPTSDYAEDCPSEQSESTCSSVASGSPVPPHHYHNHHNNNNNNSNNNHHHHQAQLHLTHQQNHSSHHYQAHSNHSHQTQPQLQQQTLSSNAKNKHPHHIPYDPKVHVTSKPPYSFSCLIFMSIEDSKLKALPVKEIYTWILDHFPYYRNAPTGWKNSVRHNLSLNKCFRKVDKAPNLGKGSLWMVDPVSRPKLVEALMKAPYHPYTNLDKNNSAPNLRKRSPSPETGAGAQEDELDDVDAAAAMLVLKHGPQARLHISHTREEYHKRQKMALQTTPPNGLKIKSEDLQFVKMEVVEFQDDEIFNDYASEIIIGKEEDSVSMAQDHTYSWADSSIEQASADEAFAEGSDSNSSSLRGYCDDEERRKTAEGADALLNLAGITTTPSAHQISQPPPLKKFRPNSPQVPQPPLVITSIQYHNEHHSHHMDAVNNNNNNNNNSSMSSGDESGPNERRVESGPTFNNKLRRKPVCPQRIKTKR